MVDEPVGVLVCLPVEDGFVPVAGSQEEICADCVTVIWVSPASKKVAGEGAIYCCPICSVKRISADPDPRFGKISDEQLEELREAMDGYRYDAGSRRRRR